MSKGDHATAAQSEYSPLRIKLSEAGVGLGLVGPDGTEVAALEALAAHGFAAETNVPLRPSRTVAFFGDSITNAPGQAMLFGYRVNTFADSGTNIAVGNILWADPETPSGAGTLTYNQVTRLLSWAAFGESAGTAVDVSRSGIYYLPSSVAGHGLTVVIDGSNSSYATGTASATVAANGNQYQAIYNSRGFAPVSLMIAGPSWDFAAASVYPYGLACGGMPGYGSAALVSAIWQTSQIHADADVICIGTNDVASGLAAAVIIDNIKAFVASRFAAGTKSVGVMTIPPKDANTATMNKVRSQVNRWMFDYAKAIPGLTVLDTAAAITDPSNAHYVTNFSADGIHPSNLGAFAMAKVVAAWLVSLYKDCQFLPDYGDLWDATYNPYGSLIPAAGYNSFEGTGGTAGTGASGTVPANYTVNRDVGSAITAVCSKVARTDGVPGSWFQVELANATASSSPWERIRLFPQTNYQLLSTYGLAAGDLVELLAEVNIPASSGLVFLDAVISWATVSGRFIQCNTDVIVGNNSALTDAPGKLWLRSPKGASIPVGATGFSVTFRQGTINGGTATIKWGRWAFRKVRASI